MKVITRVESVDQEEPRRGIFYAKDNGHGGQTDALNLGLRFCHGNYIARLDADDVCLPGRFQRQLEYMKTLHSPFTAVPSAIRSSENANDHQMLTTQCNRPLQNPLLLC